MLLYASDNSLRLYALGADVRHCGHLVEGLPDALVDDEHDPYNKSQDGDDKDGDDKVLDVLRNSCVINFLGSDAIHRPNHHKILCQNVPA